MHKWTISEESKERRLVQMNTHLVVGLYVTHDILHAANKLLKRDRASKNKYKTLRVEHIEGRQVHKVHWSQSVSCKTKDFQYSCHCTAVGNRRIKCRYYISVLG